MDKDLLKEFENIRIAFMKAKEDIDHLKSMLFESVEEEAKQQEQIEFLAQEVDKLKTELYLSQAPVTEKHVIGNIMTRKAHLEDCPFGKKIKNDKKVDFESIQSAHVQGFEDCVCVKN